MITPGARARITELLHAGHSDRAIGRQLHCDPRTVATIRANLGLPKSRPGIKPAATIEALFHARTQPASGGHLRWTGYTDPHRTPIFRYRGRIHSAYRVAFRIRTGRDPVGNALPTCDYDGCVQPAHVGDRVTRHNQAAMALLGGAVAS